MNGKKDCDIAAQAASARQASFAVAGLSETVKNGALNAMAAALEKEADSIIAANRLDLAAARRAKLPAAMLDRLALDRRRVKEMADSLRAVAALPDPVGRVISAWQRPNGLWIHKVRVPIGVVAIIYESRPNVAADCIGLCFKSGNSVILRGGSEALRSSLRIYSVLKEALRARGIPEGAVNMVSTSDRRAVEKMLKMNDFIDVVIPRGGEGLIRYVTENSLIPVIKHYKGICHVYVDEFADLNMAERVCYNAKVQRPGVCNAMECMLVHDDIAGRFLPGMAKRFREAGVELRACEKARAIIKTAVKASESDYRTEYLDLKLSVKVVGGVDEAAAHINEYGSHHSDAIVTENYANALVFLRRVDSACVYVNASTRFTDGYQFGLGAEIGISTDKLHARGPMALEELTTYKYMVFGNGQVRE
ncbi:MAG: glutamate-5-semialdehyde dehydrogenase [Candidatus Omnitrophica bacterium]|nr:glutamate-5-semialdehyde dehydrogenase [Candidatus Omnitrophota bacterium]